MDIEKNSNRIIAYPDLYNSDVVTSYENYNNLFSANGSDYLRIEDVKLCIPLHFNDVQLLIRSFGKCSEKTLEEENKESNFLVSSLKSFMRSDSFIISLILISASLLYVLMHFANIDIFSNPFLIVIPAILLVLEFVFAICIIWELPDCLEKQHSGNDKDTSLIKEAILSKYPKGSKDLPLVRLSSDYGIYSHFYSVFVKLDQLFDNPYAALESLNFSELSQAYDDFMQMYVFLSENKKKISSKLFAEYMVQLEEKSEKLVSILDDLFEVLDDYHAESDKARKQAEDFNQSIADEEAQMYYPVERSSAQEIAEVSQDARIGEVVDSEDSNVHSASVQSQKKLTTSQYYKNRNKRYQEFDL